MRTGAGEEATLGEIRRVIQSLDPNVVPMEMESISQYMTLPLFAAHTTGVLLALFGSVALLLATIGLSGVVSYSVSQRTNEIGVRMALGADRLDVVRLILKQGMRLTGIGILIGLALSFAATRVVGWTAVRDQGRRSSYLCFRCPLLGCRGVHLVLRARAPRRFARSDEIASSGVSRSCRFRACYASRTQGLAGIPGLVLKQGFFGGPHRSRRSLTAATTRARSFGVGSPSPRVVGHTYGRPPPQEFAVHSHFPPRPSYLTK